MGWEGRLHMHGTRRDYLGTGLTGWRYYYLPDEAFVFFLDRALAREGNAFLCIYFHFDDTTPYY
jgi:hypothetical protein